MMPLALFYLIITLGIFFSLYSWRRFDTASSIFIATLLIMTGLSRILRDAGQPEAFAIAVEIAGVSAALVAAIQGLTKSRTAKKNPRESK